MAQQQVMCVFFRASDGKRPSDLSRNMKQIDAATGGATAIGLMTDPKDSSVYLLPFPPGTAEETILQITRALDRLHDPADNEQLLEAWHGRVSAQSLGGHAPQRGCKL